jgi:tRNA A37 threonylcarbamoyladenosine modification protein TsaB
MINNFLIIDCIGKDDKLGLRINKDFFIRNLKKKKNKNEDLIIELIDFLNTHKVMLDNSFAVIVNQGPGSFSAIRISLAVAKGLEIAKKVKLFGYKDVDLKAFSEENIERLLSKNLIEKKLIKPIYFS